MLKNIFIFFNKFNIILLNTIHYKLLKLNFIFFLKKNKKKIIFFFNKKKTVFLFLKNNKKKKIIKKKSKIGKIKEIKMNLNIHIRDYNLKIKKTLFFLSEGYTVKLFIILKGREIIFKEKGIELILKFQNNINGLLFKFSNIEVEGKNLYSVIIPKKKINYEN